MLESVLEQKNADFTSLPSQTPLGGNSSAPVINQQGENLLTEFRVTRPQPFLGDRNEAYANPII
jgi:hypothetical protein